MSSSWLLGACILLTYCPASAFIRGLHHTVLSEAPSACSRSRAAGQLCMQAKRGVLTKAFKKPTGALTVSLEYTRSPDSSYSENDLIVLSMQLRKNKAASLWTANLDDLRVLSQEQKSAKGNFPGPCPVVYAPASADAEQIEAAAAAGADGVVLQSSHIDLADAVSEKKMEVIWDVKSAGEIKVICDKAKATNFLIPGAEAINSGLLAALPKDAVGICSVDCQSNEVEIGRSLARDGGVKALVIRGSCIGDVEWDLPYSRFAIEGLTSKANPNFQITGIGSSKGGGGDGRRSFGADASGRQMQDKMSVQKDINRFHDKPGGTDLRKIAKRGTSW